MLSRPIIKICGIRDEITAKHAINCGADWIGFIFHPSSKRNIEVSLAAEISRVVHDLGGKTVGVFVEQAVDEIVSIVEQGHLDFAQLHGNVAREAHADLPNHIARIYVVQIEDEEEKNRPYSAIPRFIRGIQPRARFLDPADKQHDDKCSDRKFDPDRDYLLFDAITSGEGKTFDWQNVQINSSIPWLLAGGLNPVNIKDAMSIYQPHGFDVSSGVEVSPGVKSNALISQFVSNIRGT